MKLIAEDAQPIAEWRITVAEAAVYYDLKRVTFLESIRMHRTLHSRSAEVMFARYHDFETVSYFGNCGMILILSQALSSSGR